MADIKEKKSKILVAAIDFGTTYSGYAFSLKHHYQADPLKIFMNLDWKTENVILSSYKAPTCVLFDNKLNFHSFGFEAEDNYIKLAEKKKHKAWYFFKRFKMRLHEKESKVSRDQTIQDEQGRHVCARLVFGEAIKYLKNHLLDGLKKQDITVADGDIHWVITVPAISIDSAKQFMREAAYEAKIHGARLSIALEPEVASLFCQALPSDKITLKSGGNLSDSGCKYMVIDLGGGTADITVHEIQTDAAIKELHKASGGAWGGTKIDLEFEQMLMKIVGGPVLHTFRTEYSDQYLNLQREFELKKRTVKPVSTGDITVKGTMKLLELYKESHRETIEQATEHSLFKDKVKWLPDKIRIDAELFKKWFKQCSDQIVDHVKKLFDKPEVKDTDILLMVGGFSDSKMIHDAIEKAFPNCDVIVPIDASLCVLKGAVIFGHRPVAFTSRISKYTYGVCISQPFDAKLHKPDHKVTVAGVERCRDVFKMYIQEGESITVGDIRSGKHIGLSSTHKQLILKIYVSVKKEPKYVDEEGSENIGQVVVDLPNSKDNIRVEVKMMFAETELAVEAVDLTSNKKFRSYFDFL